MPDPRMLPLLDLIAANIAAAVMAERAAGTVLEDAETKKPRDPSGDGAMDFRNADTIRTSTATG